jgi:hypothetical protein
MPFLIVVAFDRFETNVVLWGGGAILVLVIIMLANYSTHIQPAPVVSSTAVSAASSSGQSTAPLAEVPADAPLTPAELRTSRKSYAAGLDRIFIENGVESTTKTAGPQDTTLHITHALTGRVAANRIGKSLDFDHLKELGFKKVVLTNGFQDELNETFSWTVNNQP